MSSFKAPSDRNHVVVVGSANQDLTAYTKTLPTMGETVMGQKFESGCGGKGANQANAAASLALAPVTMVCRLGSDVFGENLLKNFKRKGVYVDESTCVLTDPDIATGVASITVDTTCGDNMIIVAPGANYELKPDDVRKQLSAMKSGKDGAPAVVVVQLEIKYESALEALKVAKEQGAITVLNPAPAPEKEGALDEFYQYTDILIPNETELRTLCGVSQEAAESENDEAEEKLAKMLLNKGVSAVIVTLGARGAMIVTKEEPTSYVSAPDDLPCKNDPVEDTIGAGDGFCGALSTYMSAGLDLNQAAQLACGFAGLSVRRRGANYPSPDELPDCLLVSTDKASNKATVSS